MSLASNHDHQDKGARSCWSRLRDLQLENEFVLLRRISPEDRTQLRDIAFDAEIWRYFVTQVTSEADVDKFILDATTDTNEGRRVVFGVVCKRNELLAGSMAYGNLCEDEKRLEIGWSWIGRPYRGTDVNRWSKYLLLENAFEQLDCERVEFKTDVLNARARRGLEKIGAVQEGILRSYNFMPGNRRRDAVYYSILKAEWPSVKDMLRRAPSRPLP